MPESRIPRLGAWVLCALSFGTFAAAETVYVTLIGEVEFNEIPDPPLGNVLAGDPVFLTLEVDSESRETPRRGR